MPAMTEQIALIVLAQCFCEYVDHFNPPDELCDTHAYAHRCEGIVVVETIYGPIEMCLQCRTDHPVPHSLMKYKTGEITVEIFTALVGSAPIQDDLDRCNCKSAGTVGHWQCGWSPEKQKPRFLVGEVFRNE